MKSKIFMLSLLLICTGIHHLQAQVHPALQYLQQQAIRPGNTPEEYFKVADSVMQIVFGSDSSEGGPMNGYRHFKQFMETRCAPVFDSVDISTAYHDALLGARDRSSTCGVDNYKGAWENIGPRTDDHAVQNQGWVTAIWSEPGVPNHIRIGTLGAGVWETTNGGITWNNLTDNTEHLGTLGIMSMTVNPNNYDQIFISGQMFARSPYTADRLGMGIWYSSNAGANWTLQTSWSTPNSIDPPAKILSTAVCFSPYLVNGENYVVATVYNPIYEVDEVYGRKGSGSNNTWVNLTPGSAPTAFGVNGWYCRNFTDIDFMPDNQGKILISSEWPFLSWALNQGVYEIEFDITTGGSVNPHGTLLVSANLNNNAATLFCNPAAKAVSFSTEYMGSGNIYFAYNLDACAAGFTTNVASLNINTPGTIANLVTGIISPFQFHGIGLKASHQEDVMYVRLANGQANFLYKTGSTWHWKAISDYPVNQNITYDCTMHGDIRSMWLATDVITSTTNMPPGYDHVMLWGTDGGISRTTAHNSDVITTPDNNAMQANTRVSENLNGANLYLGNLWDADKEVFDLGYAASGWDNGSHYYNKGADTWSGSRFGDGLKGNFDKRMSDGTNFTVIEQEWEGIAHHINPVAGAALHPGSSINQPETPAAWRGSSMQYRNDRMNMGQIRAWQSNETTNANPYFIPGGPPNNFCFNLNDAPNNSFPFPPIFVNWNDDKDYCRQFMVTPSNGNQAYYLLFGAKKHGLLNKGVVDPGNFNQWDWVSGGSLGKDITPEVVYDPDFGIPATDFCVDDKNENRIFLALGGIWVSNPSVNRVLKSVDGGDTWVDMSTGLTNLPVNCLVYQNGSDDVIYAGTDDGAYYWDNTLQCWIKMNGSIIKGETVPNTVVTKLTINYCTRKLIAATHGRGIWESDLYYPNFFPDPTEVILTNTNIVWNTDRIVEGSVLIEKGATLTIEGSIGAQTAPYQTTSTTNIYMPKWGQIIVEKGARLNVIHARITNECNTTWHGIFAYGHGGYPQTMYPAGSGLDPHHGWVFINESIIENAEEALNNGGGTDYPNTGGIIQAYGSHFINNRRSAAFGKYINLSGGTLSPDRSFIKRNLFVMNDDTRIDLYAHISMWGVLGIKVDNNIFNNTRTLDVNTTSHKTAVLSLDAGYSFSNNEVNGLYKGLEGSLFTFGQQFQVNIHRNTFDANEIGIHLVNLRYPIITENTINIGQKQTYTPGGTTA